MKFESLRLVPRCTALPTPILNRDWLAAACQPCVANSLESRNWTWRESRQLRCKVVIWFLVRASTMSAKNLSPLKLIVSHNSEGRWSGSGSTRQNSNSTNSSTKSATTSSELHVQSRTQSWLPSLVPAHLHMEEDPHDFYLGDIYARISKPFDCFLQTQAEQE